MLISSLLDLGNELLVFLLVVLDLVFDSVSATASAPALAPAPAPASASAPASKALVVSLYLQPVPNGLYRNCQPTTSNYPPSTMSEHCYSSKQASFLLLSVI